MKFFLPICLLLVAKISLAQKNNSTKTLMDSLKKYSYPIILIDNEAHDGTAFLYQRHNKIFLVSNYHVIKRVDPFTREIQYPRPSKMYFLYSSDTIVKAVEINVSDEVTGKPELFRIHEKLDLFAIELEAIPDEKLYFINDLIDSTFFYKTPNEIVSYGFPGYVKKSGASNTYDILKSSVIKINGIYQTDFNDWDSLIAVKFPTFPYSERQAIKNFFKKNYFFCSALAAKGASGSPVVGKYIYVERGRKKTAYKFVGVFFGGSYDLGKTWGIQAHAVIEYLNSL